MFEKEEMLVLSVVMSLRFYLSHLGVEHYVTHVKWTEITAITVAALYDD